MKDSTIDWNTFSFPPRPNVEEQRGVEVKKEAVESFKKFDEIDDWESFSFPSRPQEEKGIVPETEQKDEEEEEEEEEGGATSPPDMVVAPNPGEDENKWEYKHEEGFLVNLGMGKKIDLKDLSDVDNIKRLLALTKLNNKWNYPSLRRSMEKASWVKFDMGLDELVFKYDGYGKIPWKPKPKAEPTLSMKHK